MKIFGIIIEANPFHNGHQYLIDEIKNKYSPNCLIAVTSNYFTMRGEISLLSKKEKVISLLKGGCNIVLELPIHESIQSADYFALNSVMKLSKLHVTDIACGCETDDFSKLDFFLNIFNSESFKIQIKMNLSLKLSYKQLITKTLQDLQIESDLIELFNSPNFTLAFLYYKSIKDNQLEINLHLIKRTNSYHSRDLDSNVVSATAIRTAVENNEDCSKFLPFNQQFCNLNEVKENFLPIIKYEMCNKENFKNAFDPEGILNYIHLHQNEDLDYDQYFSHLANKKYSISLIKRTVLKQLCIKYPCSSYVRIIGLDDLGSYYLKQIPRTDKSEFVGTVVRQKVALSNELLTSKIYSIICKNKQIYLDEYLMPIRKEKLS